MNSGRHLNLLDKSWRCDPPAFLSALTESLGSGWAIVTPNVAAPWMKLSVDRMPATSGATGDTPTIVARAIATCLAYLVSAKRVPSTAGDGAAPRSDPKEPVAETTTTTSACSVKTPVHIIIDLRCTPLISLQALLRKHIVEKVVALLLSTASRDSSVNSVSSLPSLREIVLATVSALHFVVVPPRGPLFGNLSMGSSGTGALHDVVTQLRRELTNVVVTTTTVAPARSSQSPDRNDSPSLTASPSDVPAMVRAALDQDDGEAFVVWWSAMLRETTNASVAPRSDSAPRSASRTTDSVSSRGGSLSHERGRSPMQDRHVNAALHLLRDHECQCRHAIETEAESEAVRLQFWLRHEASCFANHFIPHIAGRVSHDQLRLETLEVQSRHDLVHSEADARLALAELREDDVERLALWITRRNALLHQEAVVREFQRSQEVRQGDVLFAFVADRLRELHALYPPIEPAVVTDEVSVSVDVPPSDATAAAVTSVPSSPEISKPKHVTDDDPLQLVPVLSSLSLSYRRSISREAVTYHVRPNSHDSKRAQDAAQRLQDF